MNPSEQRKRHTVVQLPLLTTKERAEIADYLLIVSQYLQQMADSDALEQYQSRFASQRLQNYADRARALRNKLQESLS